MIVVSFLLNQKTLKILGSKLQNIHIKGFPERKSSTKLTIAIQCHLEYMLEIIYALAYPAEIRISKIVRQSLQILSETVRFHWFTYKRKNGDEESDSDSDAALDDDDVANSDGVISESVLSLLQVGDIAVIRADDPVFFFYLIKVTQEETIFEKFITDDYGHAYPPGSRVVKGNYLEISSEDSDQTTCYLEKKKAAILSNSVVGICPELSEINVKIKKKEFPRFILEKHLYDGLRELCNLRF